MNRRDFLKTTIVLGGATALPICFPEHAEADEAVYKDKFSTGLPSLDKLMGGGLRPGELCVVAGTTAGGKTAFCNSAMLANGMKNCLEGFQPGEPGGNDILFLNPKGYCLGINNYNTPLVKSNHEWDLLDNTTRAIREHAIVTNQAAIWTVPVLSRSLNSVVDSYSFIRCADYYIICNRERKHIFLMKNRHGDRGAIEIEINNCEFAKNGFFLPPHKTRPIMRESKHR